VIVVAITVFLTGTGSGQSVDDFSKRYRSGTYYEIRPTILMYAQFSSDGQVCAVYLQPNRHSFGQSTTYVGNNSLNGYELKQVFDELAPPNTREGQGRSLGYVISGSMLFGGFMYENVIFNIKGSTALDNANGLKKRNAAIDEHQSKMDKEFQEFIDAPFGRPETASITWTNRTCPEWKQDILNTR
jgi:hypothetical protein